MWWSFFFCNSPDYLLARVSVSSNTNLTVAVRCLYAEQSNRTSHYLLFTRFITLFFPYSPLISIFRSPTWISAPWNFGSFGSMVEPPLIRREIKLCVCFECPDCMLTADRFTNRSSNKWWWWSDDDVDKKLMETLVDDDHCLQYAFYCIYVCNAHTNFNSVVDMNHFSVFKY